MHPFGNIYRRKTLWMKLNLALIARILAILLLFNALFMWLCLPFAWYYQDGSASTLLLAGCICLALGGIVFLATRFSTKQELRKRDGYVAVTAGWLIMSLTGTLPYLLSGSIGNFSDAFFETVSGYSTTGATILSDIEALPHGILFWRSLTQWIGGMGIIVLTVAILPILGIGGMQLFIAEAPGISPDKLQPRIKETARNLWIIYVSLTLAEALLLYLGGMGAFDALNHALTTMATGGFSTKNASIAAFPSPFIQYTIIVFMLFAGTNFTMTYLLLKGAYRKVRRNEEFMTYLGICLIGGLLVGSVLLLVTDYQAEYAFRTALFHVVSVVTTTGYITEDYTIWAPLLTLIFFFLMFLGGSAGSTAGGVKISRHLVLIKNSFLELKRQLHPTAIIPVRLNRKAIKQDITFMILAFIIIYILIFVVGSLIVASMGVSFETAIGAVATSLGNIGPGLGSVGPVYSFVHLPTEVKYVLTLLMLLGRLELFTVLILFTPYFWRKKYI